LNKINKGGVEAMMQEEKTLVLMQIVAEATVQAAGRLALSYLTENKPLEIETKGPQDFVTAVDKHVELLIRNRLRQAFPDHTILGEEFGLDKEGARVVWILDPIDGTSNFMRHRPSWCVPIGATIEGKPALGVIFDPINDEMFSAAVGRGATRNGQPISVNQDTTLNKSVFGVGFTSGKSVAAHAQQISHILDHGCEYRRFGSSAMMLAHVADGRLDGYADARTSVWDVIAGLVLVREAGGVVQDFIESGAESGSILAAAPGAAETASLLLAIDQQGGFERRV